MTTLRFAFGIGKWLECAELTLRAWVELLDSFCVQVDRFDLNQLHTREAVLNQRVDHPEVTDFPGNALSFIDPSDSVGHFLVL